MAPLNNNGVAALTNRSRSSLGKSGEKRECAPHFVSDVRRQAFNLLALRRAAAVAAASSSAIITNNPRLPIEDFVRLSRQRIELEECLTAAEQAFIDKMVLEMHHQEMVRTVFELMDLDDSGTVDVVELAEGLRKMNDLNAIAEVLPLAEKTMETYSSETNKDQLTMADLHDFLLRLCETMDCTFSELAQLIVSKIAFSESGRALLQDAVSALANPAADDQETLDDFDDAVVEARLILVFDLLDDFQTGQISFKEVVKHLSRFTLKAMNPTQRQVLLMVNENQDTTIDYAEFSELILNVVASFDEPVEFHEIADAITLSACRQDITDDDIRDLFVDREAFRDAMHRTSSSSLSLQEDEKLCEQDLAYGKLNRLFDLWDLDHNGTLDLTEFTLGLCKFQETRDVQDAMERTKVALAACDRDNDNHLNRREFATVIFKFADASGMDLHRLVDFMVVHSALKDSSSKEKAYLKSLKLLKSEDKNLKRSNSNRSRFAGLLNKAMHSGDLFQ